MVQPHQGNNTAFRVLWWTLGLGLGYLSVLTVWHGVSPSRDLHAIIIGGVEAVSALLFLVPRTLKVGAAGLLLTIAIAFTVHAVQGQFSAALLIDAAAVWYVMAARRPEPASR